MSHFVTNDCRELRIGAAEKAVLMRLADYAEHDGTRVYPSAGRIALETCLSYRTVLRCFARLEALGVLRLQGMRGCGRGNTNHYTIDLAKVKELVATGQRHKHGRVHQEISDTETSFILGETVENTTITAQKSPDISQEKSDTVSPISVVEEPIKGDSVSIKGDTVSPDSSGTIIEDNVSPRGLTVPEAPEDHSEILWALVPALMQISGQKERAIWALMKAWRKQYGATVVLQVVTATIADKRDKPVPWIIAALAERQRAAGFKPRVVTGGIDPRWRLRLAHFRDKHDWDASLWGPEPGTPGCQAPDGLWDEIRKEGAA